MKNYEIFRLREALNTVSDLKGVKFAFSVVKNKKILDEEIEVLQKSSEMSEKYQEYESERVKMCELHSEKDDQGKAVINSGAYSIPNKEEFDKAMEPLKEKYKIEIGERGKQIKEYDKLLNDDTAIDEKLSKVKIDYVPDDISSNQLESIKEMIED